MDIVIVDYGAGNTRSVQFAFERLGLHPTLTADPDEIARADKVIFPGVGEASTAMRNLAKTNLDSLIPGLKQPVLGICLGMQMMCLHSQENDTHGMKIFDDEVIRFENHVKVPQIGWNTIRDLKSELFHGVKEGEFMYGVHSYYVPTSDHTIATSDYGGKYTAAIQQRNFYGVQFHPEKSGQAGEQILKNFIERCE